MHRTVPGFRVLRFGDVADVNLLDGAADNNSVVADRLRAMVVDVFGLSDTPELARAFAVAVEAGDAVLKMAFRREPGGDPSVVAEADRLIRGYPRRTSTTSDVRAPAEPCGDPGGLMADSVSSA
jgi:hypothetical protein